MLLLNKISNFHHNFFIMFSLNCCCFSSPCECFAVILKEENLKKMVSTHSFNYKVFLYPLRITEVKLKLNLEPSIIIFIQDNPSLHHCCYQRGPVKININNKIS